MPGQPGLLRQAEIRDRGLGRGDVVPDRREIATEPRAVPASLVDAVAVHLRDLHAAPTPIRAFDSGHPVRMIQVRERIDMGLVEADDFGEAHGGWTPEQVWSELGGLLPFTPDPVVTHGDYSLDSILITDGRVVGCIYPSRVGIADRYHGLAILCYCLEQFDGAWRERFLAGYGLPVPDERRFRFHLVLDELF